MFPFAAPAIIARSAAPTVNFTVNDAGDDKFILTNNDRTATRNVSSPYLGTIGSTSPKSSGKFFYEIIIDAFNTYISVGLMNYTDGRQSALGLTNGGGIGYRYDGAIIKDGQVLLNIDKYYPGDLISVYVNIDTSRLELWKSGSQLAVFAGANFPVAPLIPAVTLGNSDRVSLQTSPKYPMSGFTFWPQV